MLRLLPYRMGGRTPDIYPHPHSYILAEFEGCPPWCSPLHAPLIKLLLFIIFPVDWHPEMHGTLLL